MNIMKVQTKKGASPLLFVGTTQTKKGASGDKMKKCVKKVIESAAKTESQTKNERKPRVLVPKTKEERAPSKYVSFERKKTPKSVDLLHGVSSCEPRTDRAPLLRSPSWDDRTFATARTSFSTFSTFDDESSHSQHLQSSSPGTGFACDKLHLNDDLSSISLQEFLQTLYNRELRTMSERMERGAILENDNHKEFYLCFIQQMYCMIAACEVLSTDMVQAGRSSKHGAGTVRYLLARAQQEDTIRELIRRSRFGLLIANSVEVMKKNLSVVPFSDAVCSIIQVVAAMKDERDQCIAIQRVAKFATAVSVAASTTKGLSTENGVRITVEKMARLYIRARHSFRPRRAFLEERSSFGKIKQLILHIVGETSADTPAKEQACKAAKCVLAHIMMPSSMNQHGSLPTFADIALCSSAFPEYLVAATLNASIEEIQDLPRFSSPDQS